MSSLNCLSTGELRKQFLTSITKTLKNHKAKEKPKNVFSTSSAPAMSSALSDSKLHFLPDWFSLSNLTLPVRRCKSFFLFLAFTVLFFVGRGTENFCSLEFLYQKCSVVRDSLKGGNGWPCVPILTGDPTLPGRLASGAAHLDDALDKHDTRLRIFSGTANPALAQVEFAVSEAWILFIKWICTFFYFSSSFCMICIFLGVNVVLWGFHYGSIRNLWGDEGLAQTVFWKWNQGLQFHVKCL